MADNLVDAMVAMKNKMNSIPNPANTSRQIMEAQKALINALRKNPGAYLSKMTGNGAKK